MKAIISNSCQLNHINLDFCTEFFGNETGVADMASNNDDLILCSRQSARKERVSLYNVFHYGGTPPPLTILREGIELISSRQDGRLIITPQTARFPVMCFESERKHGRLRLRFANNSHRRKRNNYVGQEKEEITDENLREAVENTKEKNSSILDKEEMEEVTLQCNCKECRELPSVLKQFWVASS